MAFPTSPTNGQTAVVNGITYTYDNTNNAWTRSPVNAIYLGAYNQANAAYIQANASFTKANSTLALTGGTVTGMMNVVYQPPTSVNAAIQISAANTRGGTGYADFITVTNTSSGANNANKFFRLNTNGGIEIINSAYTSSILSLSDTGTLSITGTIAATGVYVNNKQAVNGPAFAAGVDTGVSAQVISSGTQQKVNFTIEEYDTNSNFATSRFTPTVEGYYQLNASVRLDGGGPGTGECMIVLYKNGTEYHRGWNSSGTDFATGGWFSMSVSSQAYANGSTDYFEIYVQQTSGVNRNVTRGANISWFNGTMVRGA